MGEEVIRKTRSKVVALGCRRVRRFLGGIEQKRKNMGLKGHKWTWWEDAWH